MSGYTQTEMRLYDLQSSEGKLRVATISCQSPLPSTRPMLSVDATLSEVRPSFTLSDESVIEPTPVNDQCEMSSIPSSRRELRTFFCKRRYSEPSCCTGCIGIAGAVCCANAGP